MSVKRLLIVYHTEKGGTMFMAYLIGQGAEELGVEVEIKRVEDCKPESFVDFDGIVIGSPTFFSNVSGQVKKTIDESIAQRRNGFQLKGEIGGCFTSSETKRDGRECIRMLELAFGLHHKMKMVPGIIGASGDTEEEVANMCREYGAEIARKIISTS